MNVSLKLVWLISKLGDLNMVEFTKINTAKKFQVYQKFLDNSAVIRNYPNLVMKPPWKVEIKMEQTTTKLLSDDS